MAHDARDVAAVMAYGSAHRCAGHLPGGRHEPQRPGAGRRDHGRRAPPLARRDGGGGRETCPCAAGHGARPCERRARVARPAPRSRPGVHGHRDGRRSDREQLRRHALRCRARLLPDGSLAHVRAAVGHDDRHGAAPGAAAGVCRARARACAGAGADPGRDPRRLGAGRADQAEVRDQEHDRLPAGGVPRRRRAAGDLQAAAGRVGGDARVRVRGGVRDRGVRAPRDDGVRDLSVDRRCGRVRAPAGRCGRERHRADDGALDEGGPGIRLDSPRVERGTGRRGGDPGRVSLRRRGRAGASARRARWRCSPVARWSSRRSSRATPS